MAYYENRGLSVIDRYEPTNLTIDRSVGSKANLAPDVDRVYSGADVIAFIVPKAKHYTNTPYIPLKNLGAISYSVHRDKVPVRSLGMSKARSYTLGTRTVAGTLVLLNFDRAALSELILGNDIYGDSIQVNLYDEIPPFDIILTFSSEHNGRARGKLSKPQSYAVLEINNVRLIDEGLVTGTEEAYLETTFQYVAETVKYLQPVELNKVVPDFGEFATVNKEILDTTNDAQLSALTSTIQDAPQKRVIHGPEKAFYNVQEIYGGGPGGSSFLDPIELNTVLGPHSSYILVIHKSAIHLTTGNIHITEWQSADLVHGSWPAWTGGAGDSTFADSITDPTKVFTFIVLGIQSIASTGYPGQSQTAYNQDARLIDGPITVPFTTSTWYATENQAYTAGKLLWAQIQYEGQSSPGIY